MKKTKLPLILTIALAFPQAKAQWQQLGLDIDGEDFKKRSGWGVRLSADGYTMATQTHRSESAQVYRYVQDRWQKKGDQILLSHAASISEHGVSMDLSDDGNTIALGNDRLVKIFRWNGNSWNTPITLNSINIPIDLSEDGKTIAGLDARARGKVRVYEFVNGAWKQKGFTGTPDWNLTGNSYTTVSLANNGNAIAAVTQRDDRVRTVSVYHFVDDSWQKMGEELMGLETWDFDGPTLALNRAGTSITIGCGRCYENQKGYTRVYDWSNGAWKQRGKDIIGEGNSDQSGHSVSIDGEGKKIIVGAVFNDGANGNGSGHARVFEWNGTDWVQIGVDIDGENRFDLSGQSVSINKQGNIIAVGAPNNFNAGPGTGQVRVFKK